MAAKRSEADLPLFGEAGTHDKRIDAPRVNDPEWALKLLARQIRNTDRVR